MWALICYLLCWTGFRGAVRSWPMCSRGIFDPTFMNLCFPVSEEHNITLRKHNIGKLGAISFCLWCYEYIYLFSCNCLLWLKTALRWCPSGSTSSVKVLALLPEVAKFFYACQKIIFIYRWEHVFLLKMVFRSHFALRRSSHSLFALRTLFEMVKWSTITGIAVV